MEKEEIKRIREILMLTQKEFGELVGVSRMTIWTWENGQRTPRYVQQRRLMEIKKDLTK